MIGGRSRARDRDRARAASSRGVHVDVAVAVKVHGYDHVNVNAVTWGIPSMRKLVEAPGVEPGPSQIAKPAQPFDDLRKCA
jgi:hypothetical protein